MPLHVWWFLKCYTDAILLHTRALNCLDQTFVNRVLPVCGLGVCLSFMQICGENQNLAAKWLFLF